MTAEQELAAERAARGDYGEAMMSLSIEATLADLLVEESRVTRDQRSYVARLRSQLTSSRDRYETAGTQREVTLAYLCTALEYLDQLWQAQATDAAILTTRRERAYRRLAGAILRPDQPRRARSTTTTREA